MSANGYGESFAELYDLFYSRKPYAEEASFLDGVIRSRLGVGALSLLEVACGTGNHSFEFERLGYEVTATDLSADMINVARQKGATRKSNVRFSVSDMRAAGDQEPRYDAAVCLFDSIGYLETNAQIVQGLRSMRQSLRPKGLCVVEYWHAGAMLSSREEVRVKEWQTPQAQVIRVSKTACHHDIQCCSVDFDVIVLKPDGTWRRFRETHRNRYFLKCEMEALLEAAGLRPLTCYSDYHHDVPITDGSWHLVSLAESV